MNLNIRTNFPPIQYNDAFDSVKMIEELMLHTENIVSVLETLQMEHTYDLNEKQSEFVSAVCVWARETLWKAQVVESKLDAIANTKPSRWGNHTIATYIDIKELCSITEELTFYLRKFEKILKNLNINETLVFSLDIPPEYLKNYLMFLFIPLSIFTKKFEQI